MKRKRFGKCFYLGPCPDGAGFRALVNRGPYEAPFVYVYTHHFWFPKDRYYYRPVTRLYLKGAKCEPKPTSTQT